MIATLVGTGGQVGTIKLVDMALNGSQRKEQQAQQAGQTFELLTGLNRLAEASKLRVRDSETALGFFQSVLAEGRDAVWITPQALAQSGLGDQLAQAIPGVAEQIDTAVATGHDIRLPIAELMATMAGPELAQSLLPHIATEPGGFTQATAQEYLQSGQAQELQAEVARVLEQRAGNEAWDQSAQDVENFVFSQLQQSGRFTADVNRADATLHKAFASVMAGNLGTTPMDFFNQHTLRVVAERITGKQFDQVLPGAMPSGMQQGDGEKLAAMYRREDETRAVLLGQVGDRLAADGAQAGAHLETFSHSADISALNHVRNQHGSDATELARGQLPVRDTDIAAIPDIVANYDAVRFDLVSELGRPMIAYAKQTPDGAILYFEEVHNKRHDLAAHSMRRYPATSDAVQILHNVPLYVRNDGGHGKSIGTPSEDFNQADGNRGAFNPDTSTIALLKNADLSTFLHESGHFFLEVMTDVAAQPSAPAAIRQDMEKLLAWFGVSDLQAWNAMTLEEKRPYTINRMAHEHAQAVCGSLAYKAKYAEEKARLQAIAVTWLAAGNSVDEALAKLQRGPAARSSKMLGTLKALLLQLKETR